MLGLGLYGAIFHVPRGMRCNDMVNVFNRGDGTSLFYFTFPAVMDFINTCDAPAIGECHSFLLLLLSCDFSKAVIVAIGLVVRARRVVAGHTPLNPVGSGIRRPVFGTVFVALLYSVCRWMILLELVDLPLPVGASTIELTVFAGCKVIPRQLKHLGTQMWPAPFWQVSQNLSWVL